MKRSPILFCAKLIRFFNTVVLLRPLSVLFLSGGMAMLSLASCNSDGIPSNVLQGDKMIDLLVDLHLADGYSSTQYNDTTGLNSVKMYTSLYKKYNLDSAGIRHNLDYYIEHPDKMIPLYDSVNARLEHLQRVAIKNESERYRIQSERVRDSLYYHDKRLDSIYKGMIMDTMSYGPFYRFSPKAILMQKPVAPPVNLPRPAQSLRKGTPLKKLTPQ